MMAELLIIFNWLWLYYFFSRYGHTFGNQSLCSTDVCKFFLHLLHDSMWPLFLSRPQCVRDLYLWVFRYLGRLVLLLSQNFTDWILTFFPL